VHIFISGVSYFGTHPISNLSLFVITQATVHPILSQSLAIAERFILLRLEETASMQLMLAKLEIWKGVFRNGVQFAHAFFVQCYSECSYLSIVPLIGT
jgi:hypothetical protein